MKKISLFFVLICLLLISYAKLEAQENSKSDSILLSKNEYLVQSVLWFQRSAEMRALYYQSYQLAKFSMDENLKTSTNTKKKAVIVDVDETLLDNSPFEGHLILSGEVYTSETWKNWVDKADAKPLPGVLDFMAYAKAKNVEIFYISNRKTNEIEATAKNLVKYGFPNIDEQHLLFKTSESAKNTRREIVSKDYDVLLLIGDNLGDFDGMFDKREGDCLFGTVDANKDKFGTRFIILPNPMYGDWERCIYEKAGKPSPALKNKQRKDKIISY